MAFTSVPFCATNSFCVWFLPPFFPASSALKILPRFWLFSFLLDQSEWHIHSIEKDYSTTPAWLRSEFQNNRSYTEKPCPQRPKREKLLASRCEHEQKEKALRAKGSTKEWLVPCWTGQCWVNSWCWAQGQWNHGFLGVLSPSWESVAKGKRHLWFFFKWQD